MAEGLRNAAREPGLCKAQDDLVQWVREELDSEVADLQRQHEFFLENLAKRLVTSKSLAAAPSPAKSVWFGNGHDPVEHTTLSLADIDEPVGACSPRPPSAQQLRTPQGDRPSLLSVEQPPTASKPKKHSTNTVRLQIPEFHKPSKSFNSDLTGRGVSEKSLTSTFSASTALQKGVSRLAAALKQERRQTGYTFQDFVQGEVFENVFLMLIMCNTTVMAVEAQYIGDITGRRIGYGTADSQAAADNWPHAQLAFDVAEWFFGVIFTLEIMVKILAMRLDVLRSPWNYLDAVVVIFFLLWATVGSLLPKVLVSFTRLARLLRITKLLRALRDYDSLYLMITSLVGSMKVLGWSVVLLFISQVFCALTLQLLVQTYMDGNAVDPDALKELYMYFGSFLRAMLTMFEMTFGNWYTPCRVLVENCSEWYMLFFMAHLMIIGFATIAVINGVFINETFKVAEQDDKFMLMRQAQDDKIHTSKMKRLFQAADLDGSGAISCKEFAAICTFPDIRNWLSAMQVDFENIDTLFDLIDENGDGDLTVEELVRGVGRLKGQAKAFELVDLRKKIQRLDESLSSQLGDLNRKLKAQPVQVAQSRPASQAWHGGIISA